MKFMIREENLVWRAVGEEVVALDLQSSKYLRVNASGALLWQRMQQPVTRDELVGALIDCYDLSQEQAVRDLDEFLSMLSENELLR